jgi:acyl carrier protein
MTDTHEVALRIAELFAMLHLEVPSEDTDLIESGLMDSLLLVEFLTHLEEQMGVSVPIEELEPDDFRTIQSITAFVLANQRTPKSAAHA